MLVVRCREEKKGKEAMSVDERWDRREHLWAGAGGSSVPRAKKQIARPMRQMCEAGF